jgi:hypothetical protein
LSSILSHVGLRPLRGLSARLRSSLACHVFCGVVNLAGSFIRRCNGEGHKRAFHPLLDCILPGGTMWQVVLEADRQEIPVVLMTGDPSQRKDVAGGERPYILKPFTLQALIDIVEANVPTAAEG